VILSAHRHIHVKEIIRIWASKQIGHGLLPSCLLAPVGRDGVALVSGSHGIRNDAGGFALGLGRQSPFDRALLQRSSVPENIHRWPCLVVVVRLHHDIQTWIIRRVLPFVIDMVQRLKGAAD
jgi:hypothetical protein